ncbi:MAG: nucleotidyltransferase domain-containing protein [Candidatus Melainabacteria bacterium]|nr:nucleotidyltransferase domain-containing protein [Candidatus Melainabacteria bacterium]
MSKASENWLRMRRKTKLELKKLLTELYERVNEHYELDEVLLYGSYAKGNPHEWSDVDVTLVSPNLKKKSILGNVMDISQKIKFYDPDLQLVAFPSKTYYQEDFVDKAFVQEIKKTVKKIYSKDTGLDFSLL